jgi:hypothetical protein
MEKALVSKGNKKLPTTTWIFNAGTATDCPSKALGLCQAGKLCYAMKAEFQYPAVKPFRKRQFKLTQTVSPNEFASQLLAESKRARTRKMKAFRFNESGDFCDQEQVNWFALVCGILKHFKVKCYGYTARTDLDLSNLMLVATVNVSNDKNGWIEKGANRFKMVQSPSLMNLICAGDCRICKLCQTKKGTLIQVQQH